MSAHISRLRLFQRHLRSLVRVCISKQQPRCSLQNPEKLRVPDALARSGPGTEIRNARSGVTVLDHFATNVGARKREGGTLSEGKGIVANMHPG
jgi:hypothetical protein